MFNKHRKFFEDINWPVLAGAEGVFTAFRIYVYKVLGTVAGSLPLGFLAGILAGFSQMVSGAILTVRSGYLFFPNKRAVWGSVLSGILAAFMIIMPIYIFAHSDISLISFGIISSLAILPGALTDKFMARGRLNINSILGIVFGLITLYALLFMSKGVMSIDSVWTWLALTYPIAFLGQNFITRFWGTAGAISPWVHAFWTGFTTTFLGVIGILIFGLSSLSSFDAIFSLSNNVYYLMIALGLLIILIILSRQKTFRTGGRIAYKKLMLFVVKMISVLLIAFLIMNDTLQVFEVVAIVSTLISYLLIIEKNPFRAGR